MTARIDVAKNGKPWLTNQPNTDVVWKRIRTRAHAGDAIETRPHAPAPVPTPPVPRPPSAPFGDAGQFAGRGIMLGSTRDVWDQAIGIHREGYCDVVAVIPGTPRSYFPESLRVVTWVPPEVEPSAGDIHQAENQTEWMRAKSHDPEGIALNSWTYGRLEGTVALVECYYNEGWGVDFGVFANYMAQGARGVVPLGGGYSASGRTDAEAGAIYMHLATWPGGSFPGFWMYAGESYLTAESIEALKAWRP